MRRSQRLDEMEFELALVGSLEDIYDINVCVDGDLLNRRRSGYATLEFDYFLAEDSVDDAGDPELASDAKVVVSILGVPGVSFSFTADLQDPDSVLRAADDCEDLAMAIRERTGPESQRDGGLDRRWSD